MKRNKIFTKALGSQLYNARSALGYSQAKTAELAGISERWYQALESGKRTPSGEVLLKLVFVLHIDVNVFYNAVGLEPELSALL